MKIKKLFLTLLALGCVTTGVQAASIKQTIASINADANKPGGPEMVLKSISKSTGVAAATLEKQKAKTGLSYGDVYAAHSIAKASGKTFDQIAAAKAKGATWDKIAEENNVSLGGQKKTTKPVAATASPTPEAPKRSLAEEQRWRQSQPHMITNPAPQPKKP